MILKIEIASIELTAKNAKVYARFAQFAFYKNNFAHLAVLPL